MNQVHPTAIVDPSAKLGDGVAIGPYCVIAAGAQLGDKVRLDSHVVISGNTKIGPETRVFPFASLGSEPQDLKYEGEESSVEIGAHCTIRENVTINPGTKGGGMRTQVGDHCLLMAGAHVAHDCVVGDHVILANGAALAGHVTVEDWAIISGFSGVHQWLRVGAHAFVGSYSKVTGNVVPFTMVDGTPAALGSVNLVGMRRRGFSKDDIHAVRAAVRKLFERKRTLQEQVAPVREELGSNPHVAALLDFVAAAGETPIVGPRKKAGKPA